MKTIFSILAAGTMVLGASSAAFAQETAQAAAARLNVCNDQPFVSARYLDSGRLEVTCPAGSISGLSQTGLNSTAAAAAGGLVVIALLVGNDDDSTSTTTTNP